MRYLALNGFRHSLRQYFNDKVECVDQFNWTERNSIQLAQSLTGPTTVIGFSDGATAALTIANNSRHVKEVVAHSPMNRDEPIHTHAWVRLFRTKGDKTPTYNETWEVYSKYFNQQGNFLPLRFRLTMNTLDPKPPIPVRNLATLVMRLKTHQFHNCLPYLPQEILA